MKLLHYRPRKYSQQKTKTGMGCSLEVIREVWAAATYLYLTKGGFTVRGITETAKLSSSSLAANSLNILVKVGYIKRGPRGKARAWIVVFPLFETKEQP